MNVINISESNPIISHFMAQLRNIYTQNDRKLFGETIRNLGRILALEACKHLDYSSVHINTPFGATDMQAINSNPVLFAIVRAGIKLQEGVSDILPESQLGFCTCPKNNTGGRDVQLFAPCEATGKTIIISDPIMTTASSMTHTIDAIVKNGKPKKIIILNLISTNLAIKNLSQDKYKNCIIITCSIDEFTKGVRGTIPGLGDAGDLIYGKLR